MAVKSADRVAETTTDTGTGTLVMAGAAIGYRTFSAGFGAGSNTEVYYGIIQDLTGEWEIGLGTFLGASNAIRRDLVLSSSNGGALTNFPIGDKMVYATFPAESTLTLRARRATDFALTVEVGGRTKLGAGGSLDNHVLTFGETRSGMHVVSTGEIYLVRDNVSMLSTIAPVAGVTGPGLVLGAPVRSILTLETTQPTLQFRESDQAAGAGQFTFNGVDGGFNLTRYTGANFTTGSHIWRYMPVDALESNLATFSTSPITKLATGSGAGVVYIGNTSISTLKFVKTSIYNLMVVPTGSQLRIQNDAASPAVWANISSASGWAAGTSDARLKRDIAPVRYGLDTVLALNPVEFDWIADGRHDIGLVAQEVEPIIPEIVEVWQADPDVEGQIDTYALRKDALVVVLIKALQEMHARLVALEEAQPA